MRKTLLTLILTLLLVAAPLHLTFAAESIVENEISNCGGDFWYVDITITADSDASFDTQITDHFYCGFLRAVTYAPGTTGFTDNSDLDVYAVVGGNVTAKEFLGSSGDDIIDNATYNYATISQALVCGQLGIDIENNAVNSATGTIRLYFRIPGEE